MYWFHLTKTQNIVTKTGEMSALAMKIIALIISVIIPRILLLGEREMSVQHLKTVLLNANITNISVDNSAALSV
jgi:hypothetical protein